MPETEIRITPIPAFSDNYIWLITRGKQAAIVDPGEHAPVVSVIERRGLELAYILLTHHHADHVGGVDALLQRYQPQVFGPDDPRVPEQALRVAEGDRVELEKLGLEFAVLEVPAHTRSHIAFYGHRMLFSGDTLFSIGCGKLFEGTATQMQEAMDKFAALPSDTRVYCGHEYTASNCRFALQVEPGNTALQRRHEEVLEAREKGEATLPSTMGDELAANPFMRTRQEDVVAAARQITPEAKPGAEVLAVIRDWKDRG